MPNRENGLVVEHRQLAGDMFEIEFIAPAIAAECQPGQFVHVRIGSDNDPLLRRPISIYDVDKNLGSITLLYKVVGKGTEQLSKVKSKEYIDVMGPLGNPFSRVTESGNTLLLGGGVGIAPLVYLARCLQDAGSRVKVLYGVDSRENMVAFEKFRALGVELMPASADGSVGYKGMVTDLLEERIEALAIDRIYTCGPEVMMAIAADYAEKHNIWGEVSLEEHMACGVGACLACARRLKSGDESYVKVCKDGPVFNMTEVELYGGEV